MWILVIFAIIIIILIINKYKYKYTLEHYDERIKGISLKDCANFCRTTENCNGFGYDEFKKICYPSQLIISGRPMEAIFRNDYLYTNVTCNKPYPIVTASNYPSLKERRDNSLFVCRGSFDLHPQYYFFNNNKFKNIGEGYNLDGLFDVDNYVVHRYTWPRNRFNCNQYDLLIKEIENNTFNHKRNITDLNRIVEEQNKSQV